MGLLGKAIARSSASTAIADSIVDFHRKAPSFHGIVLQGIAPSIGEMLAGHGAVCVDLPGERTLILLPGGLDMELFAHRLSASAGLAVLSQFSANSPSFAIETINPFLR